MTAEIAGAVATLWTLSIAALSVSKSVRNTSIKLRDAGRQMAELSNQIESFSAVMLAAHEVLYERFVQQQDAQILRRSQVRESFIVVVKHCGETTRKANKMRPDLKSVQSRVMLLSRIRWHFKESAVMDLRLDMESMKADLTILLLCVQLQIARENDQSSATISFLQRQIEAQMVEIRNLSRFREKYHDQREIHQKYGKNSSRMVQAQEALLDLGRAVVNDDVQYVPQPPQPVGSHESLDEIAVDPVSRPQDGSHSTTLSESTATPESSTLSQTQWIVPRVSPNAAQRSSSSVVNRSRNHRHEYENGNTYVWVQDLILDIRSVKSPQIITGRIDDRRVQAFFDASFGGNIISQNYAAELQLQLYDLEEGDSDITIIHRYGNHERPIGRVKLQWSETSNLRSRPFAVYCFVTEHNIRQRLILGRRFHEKRRDHLHGIL